MKIAFKEYVEALLISYALLWVSINLILLTSWFMIMHVIFVIEYARVIFKDLNDTFLGSSFRAWRDFIYITIISFFRVTYATTSFFTIHANISSNFAHIMTFTSIIISSSSLTITIIIIVTTSLIMVSSYATLSMLFFIISFIVSSIIIPISTIITNKGIVTTINKGILFMSTH